MVKIKSIRTLAIMGVAAIASVGLVSCGNDPLKNESTASPGSEGTVTIGSADFPESQAVAEIYAGILEKSGVTVTKKLGIGSREVYLKALDDGSINLIPEYSGNLLVNVDPDNSATERKAVVSALPEALDTYSAQQSNKTKLAVLEAAAAEDKDAIVVTKVTAEKYQLKNLEDLAKACDKLALGAPPEFEKRSYGLTGLKDKYGCVPSKFSPITGSSLTVSALIKDDIQMANIFTTDPAIEDNGLVALSDPKNNFLPQQVLPLYADGKLSEQAQQALNSVSKKLATEDLVSLNREMSGDKKLSPAQAAKQWLKDKGFTQ